MTDGQPAEALFSRLLDISQEAVFLLSPAGRLTRLNAAAERLLGVRAADYQGRPHHEWPFALYDADGQALGRLDVAETVAAARQGAVAQRDILIVNAAGERQTVRARLEAVRDDAGELLCFMAVVAPLRALPQAEPRAAYLQQVLNALPTGLAIIDAARELLDANDAAAALLGVGPGELDNERMRSAEYVWYHPDGEQMTPPEINALWAQALDDGLADLVVGVRRNDGPRRWLRVSARPLRGDGEAARSLVTLADVTAEHERTLRLSRRVKEQQAALYEAEAQVRANREEIARYSAELATHLDSVIEGVVVSGLDGEPVAWNERFCEMFGLTLPQDGPFSWRDTFPLVREQFTDPQAVADHAHDVMADPEFESLVVGELRDGRAVVVHTLPVRKRDDPRVYGRLWVFRDVTGPRREQRLAQEQAAFMQRILDWIPANVYARDEQGRYLLANQATARAYGLTVAELLGKTDDELRLAAGNQARTPGPMIETDRQIIACEIDAVRYDLPASHTLNGQIDYAAAKTAFTWLDGRRVVLGVSQDVTAQRRAERDLAARQRMLQEIIDLLPANVFIKDAAGRYVLANEAAAHGYGVTVEQLIGQTDHELVARWGVPEERLAAALDSDRRALAGEQRVEYAIRGPGADGASRDYYVTKVPFTYEGQPAILGVALDVTAQREAERLVEAQRDWYQTIFDLTPGSVYVRDAEGRYVIVNRALALASGLEPDDIVGRTDREVLGERGLAPAWLDRLERTDRELLAGNTPLVRYETESIASEGRIERFMVTKAPFALLDGSPAVLGVSVDITRQVDADLMEQQLELIYNSAPMGIALVDRQGVCVRANNALVGILGVSDRRVLEGTNIYTHPLARDTSIVGDLRNCLTSGAAASGEFVVPLYTGQVVLRYGLTPYKGPTGELGAQVIVEDVTAYRRLQERMAQAAKLEALGQLAGGAAHSFRNMLTVINSFTEAALHSQRLSRRVRGDLEQVLQAGHRAADLARQLLTFSRRNELELTVFDLNELLRNLAPMLPSLLGSAVKLELALTAAPLLVQADRAQVEQMVVNLAANARQAMPEGGVLTIATLPRRFLKPGRTHYLDPQPGRYVQLEVADTGTGLSPEARAHLFEPFFTTKPEGQGTGLGLSMAYGLVQSLGGGIDVASTPGRGVRFRIYLPRISPKEAAQVQPSAPRPLPRARRNELVLVVADDAQARELLVWWLSRQLGYTVFDAASGAEALEVCDEIGEPFDLVLTEAVLPDLTGAALITRISEQCPVRQVLYLATPAEPGGAPAGAAVLARPFSLENVAQAVRAALDAPPLKPRPQRPCSGKTTATS
jgi:PAS domain S-box-containing protein